MSSQNCAGLTWVEIVIALFVVCILAALAFPVIAIPRCKNVYVLSNMKQLHLATQQVALDGITTGDKSLGWPGDKGGTFTNWLAQIVPNYLSTNDVCKLLSGPGKIVPEGKLPQSMRDSAVLVYAVSEASPTNAVFLTSANFTNTPSGGLPLVRSAKPYGDKGFVVFRKGGDGAILLRNQVGQTNLIGTFVPLLK
jgi:type II secretory pathway pseudopilin PulG